MFQKYSLFNISIGLFIFGVFLMFLGFYSNEKLLVAIFYATGGAIISASVFIFIYEHIILNNMKKKFLVLSDFIEKGIERIYTAQEVGQETPILLNKTTSLKILGIGNSWLVKGDNLKRLEEKLSCNDFDTRPIGF